MRRGASPDPTRATRDRELSTERQKATNMDTLPHINAVETTTEIIAAYVNRNDLAAEDLTTLIEQVFSTVTGLGQPRKEIVREQPVDACPNYLQSEAVKPPKLSFSLKAKRRPAVPIEKSVTPDYLISLMDGRHFKSLKRHLMAEYGMTPDDYRKTFGLQPDYPMVAPSYAVKRSELAKHIGLGRNPYARAA